MAKKVMMNETDAVSSTFNIQQDFDTKILLFG